MLIFLAPFQHSGKMHQLVRQLVEGKMLSRLIGKEFMLATLGCGEDWGASYEPTATEQVLLDLVGASRRYVPNLSWDLLADDRP